MNNSLRKKLLNAVLFQLGWFACILGGDVIALVVTAVILAVHFSLVVDQKSEWLLIVIAFLVGCVLDNTLSLFSVLGFKHSVIFQIPLWLPCLWVIFATTINHSLSWLSKQLLLSSLMGGIAGPASYLAGSKLAGVVIAEPLWQSLMILSLCWAVIMPFLFFVSSQLAKLEIMSRVKLEV